MRHLRARARHRGIAAAAGVVVAALAAEAQGPGESQLGRWDTIAVCLEPLGGTNSGVLLPDGRLLFCHDTREPVLFDPATGAQEFGPDSQEIQGCHAVGLLHDGRALYVGGADVEVFGPGTRQVKTFDPVADAWKVEKDLVDARWYPSLVPLTDGGFLACAGGGGSDNPVRIRTSEILDPATMTWSRTGDVASGTEVGPIVLLYTGEVLMTHHPPQLYDPAAGQWRLAGAFVQGPRTPDDDHADHETVLLPDGRVLAIGYDSYDPENPGRLLEIYDPAEDAWSLGAQQAPTRSHPCTLMLPDGKVLVIGGAKMDPDDPTPTNAWGYMDLVDQYDPASDTWTRLAPVGIAREYHATPILVPDGRVIVVGGEAAPGNAPPQSVIEAFSPPYLFRGARPRLTNLSKTSLARGDTVEFDVEDAPSTLEVVMLGTVASTHFMDSGNGRYLRLDHVRTGDHVCATVPAEAARAVYGHYMLFALSDGVPSVGRIVRVGPGAPGDGGCDDPPQDAPATIAATRVRVRTDRLAPARSRADVSGLLDIGPLASYPPENVTISVGGVAIDVAEFEPHRRGFRHRAPGVTVALRPSPSASSRARFAVRLRGEAVSGLAADGPLDVSFESAGGKADARVILARGGYSQSRAGVALVAPAMALTSAKFRLLGAGADSVRLTADVAGLGPLPEVAPGVRVRVDGFFDQTLTGGDSRRRGGTLRYRGASGAIRSLVLDYARARLTVRAAGLSFGPIAEGPLPVELVVEIGGTERRLRVRMVRDAKAVVY